MNNFGNLDVVSFEAPIDHDQNGTYRQACDHMIAVVGRLVVAEDTLNVLPAKRDGTVAHTLSAPGTALNAAVALMGPSARRDASPRSGSRSA